MNQVEYKVVEFVGGPLDGERVHLHPRVLEYQKARIPIGTYFVYRETVHQTKDGTAHVFEYAGVGQ